MWDVPGLLADPLLQYLAGTAALKAVLSYRGHRCCPRGAERVGTVGALNLFPVKSMRSVGLQEAHCTFTGLMAGLVADRAWVVVHGDGHRFITQRQEPKLAMVTPSIHGDSLHLDAPGMDTLRIPQHLASSSDILVQTKIWGDPIQGLDCGDLVAAWLDKYLAQDGFRLLYHSASELPMRQINHGPTEFHKRAKDMDKLNYKDAGPYHLTNLSSLADLNGRLVQGNKDPITMERFRPNIVVNTDPTLKPFDEDEWTEIYIGKTKFSTIIYTDRCRQTTVIPDKGVRDKLEEPLKTLLTYRLVPDLPIEVPYFGTYLMAEWPGTVKVGDPVYVIRGSVLARGSIL